MLTSPKSPKHFAECYINEKGDVGIFAFACFLGRFFGFCVFYGFGFFLFFFYHLVFGWFSVGLPAFFRSGTQRGFRFNIVQSVSSSCHQCIRSIKVLQFRACTLSVLIVLYSVLIEILFGFSVLG